MFLKFMTNFVYSVTALLKTAYFCEVPDYTFGLNVCPFVTEKLFFLICKSFQQENKIQLSSGQGQI